MTLRLSTLGISLLAVLPIAGLHCGTPGAGIAGPGVFPAADASVSDGEIAETGDTDTTGPDFMTCEGGPSCSDGPVSNAICGDGLVTNKEGCDDGNNVGGDGCTATCDVELGWRCPVAGLRCEAAACGDGLRAGIEECETPPGTPVVGCSATCKIQPGYDCDPPAKTCTATVCGNAKVERGEGCEDGNDRPFDGCYKCQKEPSCANGTCQASCGDGQRFGSEACDDGNTRAGDGCSPTCAIELGYACTDISGAPPATIKLPILARDFIGQDRQTNGGVPHLDFNRLTGSGVLGIVATQLGIGGRPVLACNGLDCSQNPGVTYTNPGDNRPQISTQANFAQWYTDVAAVNLPLTVTVSLERNAGTGVYSWDSGIAAQNGGKTYFDPFGATAAGWVGQGKETLAPCGTANAPDRNVSFTSETHFWFEYNGGERFDFAGDDDVWVFLNGKLAIDLGGLHVAKAASFTLDADTDGMGADTANGSALITNALEATKTIALGLTPGGVYEAVMFQAERNECGSNFKVSLKDFNKPKSVCVSSCGDGKVASDEVCDDGVNDGSYGKCAPGCKARGPRCGDGKADVPTEQCDDGNTTNNDLCTNQCAIPKVN